MNTIKENYNSIFVCPKSNCINIPEISYSYEPLNPTIKYKCNNSKAHIMIEESMKLEDYLQKTFLNIHCSFCNDLIFENEFIFSKINKVLYHIGCFKKYGLILDDEYIKINTNYLFNNCLEHCNKFSFFCQQCQASVCSKCDIDYHNDKYHILLQINTIRKTQNKKEAFKAIVSKQRALLKKIKEMNNTLIQSLENDIIIKEQILKDYENNDCNYQTIINFNNFE